jgi:hypothetical protein
VSWYLLTVYVHIVATVFWVGYVLFWMIMAGTLTRSMPAPESKRYLQLLQHAAWPPKGLPAPYRFTFPALGWANLAVLVLTGALILQQQGLTLPQLVAGTVSPVLLAKLGGVAALCLCQLFLSSQPRVKLMPVNLGLTLGVVVLSVLLVR